MNQPPPPAPGSPQLPPPPPPNDRTVVSTGMSKRAKIGIGAGVGLVALIAIGAVVEPPENEAAETTVAAVVETEAPATEAPAPTEPEPAPTEAPEPETTPAPEPEPEPEPIVTEAPAPPPPVATEPQITDFQFWMLSQMDEIDQVVTDSSEIARLVDEFEIYDAGTLAVEIGADYGSLAAGALDADDGSQLAAATVLAFSSCAVAYDDAGVAMLNFDMDAFGPAGDAIAACGGLVSAAADLIEV